MAFIQEELRNYSFKGWQGILGTGNRSTAPDNSTYYEEAFANSLSVDGNAVLTQLSSVPPAANQTEADAGVAANSTIMRGFGTPADPTTALHLTPTLNQKAFMCTSTYGDMNTRLKNFIQPQMIQNGNFASIGYTARLYQGDPNAGGVEIPTTIDQVGADVGWFFMYGAGAVVVASTFAGITDPTDVWLICYQYIGQTAASTSSTPISAGVKLMMDRSDSFTKFLNPKMSPKSTHLGDSGLIASLPNNTGGVFIPGGTNLYLADVNVVDKYEYNAIYRGFNASDGYEMTIPKVYPNEFYIDGLGWTRDEDLSVLGYEIEVWAAKDNKTSLRAGNPSSIRHGNGRHMIHCTTLTRNLVPLTGLLSEDERHGTYHVKIRDLNQGVEAWIIQKIRVKMFPIITTDSSMSMEFGHGHYISARVI